MPKNRASNEPTYIAPTNSTQGAISKRFKGVQRVGDTSRGLSARGAGAFAAEVNPTLVVESQRDAQGTIGE